MCINQFVHELTVLIKWLACRFGMRGRLWLLWSTMTFGGLFTCLMGVAGNSYAATQAFVILAAAGIEVWALPEPSCSSPCMTLNAIVTAHLVVHGTLGLSQLAGHYCTRREAVYANVASPTP